MMWLTSPHINDIMKYYCRECHHPVDTVTDTLIDEGHPNLFECKNCGHPHSLGELIETEDDTEPPPTEEDCFDGDQIISE